MSREKFAGNTHHRAKEILCKVVWQAHQLFSPPFGVTQGSYTISLMMVGNSFFDSSEHRQKAHVAIHIPVKVTMNSIITSLAENLKHCPKMLYWVMHLVGNLDAVDSSLVKAFQNLRIGFILVKQIYVKIAHTRTIVQNHLLRATTHNSVQHLTNANIFFSFHFNSR